MSPIQDFGEKIGGARKDLWKHRGLSSADLTEMTDVERSMLVRKENIWLKPDWVKLVKEGTPQGVAYWQSKMRQSLPPKPSNTDSQTQNNYVEVIQRFRDAVMAVKTLDEIDTFYDDFMCKTYIKTEGISHQYKTIIPVAFGTITEKVLAASRSNQYHMQREARKKLFGIPKNEQVYTAVKNDLSVYCYDGEDVTVAPDKYLPANTLLTIDTGSGFGKTYCTLRKGNPHADPDEWVQNTYFVLQEHPIKLIENNFSTKQEAQDFIESYARESQKIATENRINRSKDGKQRKQAFIPPQLQNMERTGPDYRRHRHANSRLFLDELKFRGGEFGNWLNGDDRQVSLDMAYDGLRDLARILQIQPADISFNGSLAIAFGARGRGGINAGSAHYEPARQVINLTKMSGAGCLAHEWGHALDHAIGISCGFTGLATEMRSIKYPKSFRSVVSALKHKTVTLSPEVVAEETLEKIKHCKQCMRNWINSEKPSNLSLDLEKKWDSTVAKILASAQDFTGEEYMSRRGSETKTKPELELLSQIRRSTVHQGLSKKAKQQVVLWAKELKPYEAALAANKPVERLVETDFYKGAQAFDDAFSRMGHGYWSSDCEMFARAFDCYVTDKLREAGVRSDYLSARADAYVMPDGNGGKIAAIPMGEERETLNAAFDTLLTDLKERGILTAYIEDLSLPLQEQPMHRASSRVQDTVPHFHTNAQEQERAVRYEQLSFDQMFTHTGTHKQQQEHLQSSAPSKDRSR